MRDSLDPAVGEKRRLEPGTPRLVSPEVHGAQKEARNGFIVLVECPTDV